MRPSGSDFTQPCLAGWTEVQLYLHMDGLPGGGVEGWLRLQGRTNVHGNPHQAHMVKTIGQPLILSAEAMPSPPSISRQTL